MGSSVTNPQFVFELIRGCQIVVSYQGTTPPQPIEVEEFAQLIESLSDRPETRFLWYTEGARLSREELDGFAQRDPKLQWRSAVVSASPEMRFIASAFSLSNRNLRYFTPDELPQALRHLQCTREEQEQVLLVLSELRYVVERSASESGRSRRSQLPKARGLQR